MPIALLHDVEFFIDGEAFHAKWRGPRVGEVDVPGHWEVSGDTFGPLILLLHHETNIVELGAHALALVQAYRLRASAMSTVAQDRTSSRTDFTV